jgi:signal transduction histidine kinase
MRMKRGIINTKERQLWLSVGMPIALLVLAISLGSVAILSSFALRQDKAFEEGSRQLVSSALRGRTRASSNTVKDYAFWNDAYGAITRDWNPDWVEQNFVSAVADGLVVFRADRVVRHSWFGDPAHQALADAIALHLGSDEELLRISRADKVADRVISRTLNLDGRLLIVSAAPISREGEAALIANAGAADFVASVDFLDAAELASHGEMVGLGQLSFTDQLPSRDSAKELVAMELPNAVGAGWLTWRNDRPGSASFLSQAAPVIAFLLLAGLMSIWVMRRSVAKHLQVLAHADAEAESSRAKSEFIATMSHELRTPLNAIIGYSELVKEELEDIGQTQSCADLTRIETAGRHLLQLIEDILDHARADSANLVVDLEPTNVADALTETASYVAPAMKEQNNSIAITIAPNVTDVFADHVRLQQCLLNLASNAAKFTHGGVVRLNARLVSANGRDFVAIDVVDTGIGITAEAMSRLFSPFVQADQSINRIYGGTGLGLSITRKLARAMGGDVAVSSALGRGSTFTLTLPASGQSALSREAA